MQNGHNRLAAIDVLRGVAVSMVIGRHYFSDRSSAAMYPFGDALLPLFKYGNMGVSLFFIISGFVIALTLDSSPTPIFFLRRRFCRLWPALTFWTVVVFALLSLSNSQYAQIHRPHWFDLLPTLTLVPVNVFTPIFPEADLINSAYWTLVIEVQFYLAACIVFWAGSRRNLARNLFIFAIANVLFRAAVRRIAPPLDALYSIFLLTDFMPWFAAGAVFYEWFERKIHQPMAAAMTVAMFLIVARTATFEPIERSITIVIVISALFFLPFILISIHSSAVALIQNELFRRIGRWSYSIYLLHLPIGLLVISEIPRSWSALLQIALVSFVVGGVIVLGWLSFTYIETPGGKWLDLWLRRRITLVVTGTPPV
jgi:peptidoglycan/LPS O-acetylase OafA/YrhL